MTIIIMSAIVSLLFDFSVMIAFAIIAYLISHKIKQPANILIIIAGIIIGPSILGLVHYTDAVSIIARTGGIFLLIGLGVSFTEIFNRRSIIVGISGAFLSFVGGIIVSYFFGFDFLSSMFIGTVITSSCIAMTADVLRRIGRVDTVTSKLILSAAIIDNIIGLIILSSITVFYTGTSVINISVTLAAIIAFIVLVIFTGTRLIPRFIDRFDRYFGIVIPHITFMLGICIVFIFAFIAESIGLLASVGAFLAGVAMSKSLSNRFLQHGGEYIEVIYGAIFFAAIGIATDISVLWLMAPFIVALSFVAILTKFVGCSYAARKFKIKRKYSIIAGIGMAPRGEVAFVIALNGLAVGIVSKQVYSAIVFVSFITTVFALVTLKKLYEGNYKINSQPKPKEKSIVVK